MMKYTCFLGFLFIVGLVNAQKIDTVNVSERVKVRLDAMRRDRIDANAQDIINSFNDISIMIADRAPSGSMSLLRNGVLGRPPVVFINEGGRSGRFVLDTSDMISRDDSAMTIVVGKDRYKRESLGSVRPEWFGANPKDQMDDAPAIQRALNSADESGISLQFSEGTYLIGTTLKPKKIGNGAQFKIFLVGKGTALTVLKGMASLKGKDMVEFEVPSIKPRLATYITVRDIEFKGGVASRIIFANNVSKIDIQDCSFWGGDSCGVQIGDKITENYSVYINRCYFNGVASNNGHNLANLRMYARYPVVNQMVSDGSLYGIDLFADRAFIENCLIEGSKRAGIYIKTSGGGNHKIIGNDFILYGGFEASARYNGTMSGIYIESISGGSSNNIISNNWIYLPKIEDKVLSIQNISGDFKPSPSTWLLKGASSKAKARLLGYDQSEGRMVVSVLSGAFKEGEEISQENNNGKAKVSSLVKTNTYGIQLLGEGGYNIISDNQFRGAATVAMNVSSPGNIISNNFVEAKNGILVHNDVKIFNNSIHSPSGFAINGVNGEAVMAGNVVYGTMINVADMYLKSGAENKRAIHFSERNHLIIQNGGEVVDSGEMFQVNGSTSLRGNLNLKDVPLYQSNTEAREKGLVPGDVFKTSGGDLKICY